MNEDLFENIREKAMRKKIPILVHLDLTYKCNLNCIHCYITAEDKPELSTLQIKDILNQLAKAGVLYLTLSGGEIFTRKDFFEIASYVRELHFALRLLTNGILIDEKIADKIASLYPELVGISIYSTKPKIHDSITQQTDSLEKSILAAKILRQREVRVKLSNVIMEQNVNDYSSVHELAQELGATFQADYRISPKTNGSQHPLKFHINDEQLYCILSDPIFVTANEPELQESYSGIFNTFPCGAAHMSCYISPYGDVYPCVQFPISCGNLKENSFINIWKESPQILDVRSITIPRLKFCSKCEFFQHCRLCIGLNYTEEGSVFLPSKRTCKEAKFMKQLNKRRR